MGEANLGLWRILRLVYNRYLRFQSFIRLKWFLGSIFLFQKKITIGNNLQINHKVVFQGKGQVFIGENVLLGHSLAGLPSQPIILQPREKGAAIEIGTRSAIMNGCELIACQKIHIGKDCRIGPGTLIMDSDFHGVQPDLRNKPGITSPVSIGDNVWIGARCIILKGVNIGNDVVISAGSVIYKDIGPGEIVSSNSMKVIGCVYE